MPTVTYSRLINLGKFENERIEFTDDVQPGESPNEAYLRVRRWVYEAAGIKDPLAPVVAPVGAPDNGLDAETNDVPFNASPLDNF